ncbi:MAG: hypothetical protein DDT31_01043 [Syntrophomonadaceae bacterium]|nr:hypothetical protein [Bacillota bacterium]
MSRLTVTREQLRRAICIELMMPFALRYQDGFLLPTGAGTQTTVIDTKLAQPNAFWNSSWVLVKQDNNIGISLIRSFATNTLTLETALGFNTSVTTPYEIHSVFNGIEIHQAINRAILDSHPAFYEEREDDILVVAENQIEYDLTRLLRTVEVITSVAIEQPVRKIFGQASAVTSTTVTDTRIDLSEVNTLWRISFYGNLNGQHGVHSNITGVNNITKTITFQAVAGFNVQTNVKFMLWNPLHQEHDWRPIRLVSFDRKEWPSRLRFHQPYSSAYGHRIRIRYATVPSILNIDTNTTVVPREFIIPKAISLLASSRINDNRVDRQRYAVIAQQKAEEAEFYRRKNFFRRSDVPMWMEGGETNVATTQWDGDPLNWGR